LTPSREDSVTLKLSAPVRIDGRQAKELPGIAHERDVEQWLTGTAAEAHELQKPRADEEIAVTPYDEKKAA